MSDTPLPGPHAALVAELRREADALSEPGFADSCNDCAALMREAASALADADAQIACGKKMRRAKPAKVVLCKLAIESISGHLFLRLVV